MPKLFVVTPGHYLHFPENVDPRRECWLRPGGVLDMDDAYMVEAVKGQEYKLAPAPEGEQLEADPIRNERMRILREQFLGTYKAPKTEGEELADEAHEQAAEEGLTDAIPEPVLTIPKKSKPKEKPK